MFFDCACHHFATQRVRLSSRCWSPIVIVRDAVFWGPRRSFLSGSVLFLVLVLLTCDWQTAFVMLGEFGADPDWIVFFWVGVLIPVRQRDFERGLSPHSFVATGFSASRLLALANWSLSETASPIYPCWSVRAFRGNGLFWWHRHERRVLGDWKMGRCD